VIAVFTKFDQFKIDIEMKLEDQGRDPKRELDPEVGRVFNKYYLANLSGPPPFVCLERMHRPDKRCTELIEKTADALGGGVLSLMLMAVQKKDLVLSINQAIKWVYPKSNQRLETETVVKLCMAAFPSIWFSFDFEPDLENSPKDNLLFKFKDLNALISQVTSLVANLHLSSSSDNTNHIIIATILILEYASRKFASFSKLPPREALDQALNEADSIYITSGLRDAVRQAFPKPLTKDELPQFKEFIIGHLLK